MTSIRFESVIPASQGEVFDWHAKPGAFERLSPPWMEVHLKQFEGIEDGDVAEFQVGLGPMLMSWRAVHEDYEPGKSFTDVQEKGPFKHWRHVHRMESTPNDRCRLIDEIEYELPLGKAGTAFGETLAHHNLKRQFSYRHHVTAADIPRQRAHQSDEPLRIAISGSSGLIGSAVTNYFRMGGHDILRLVRSKPTAENEVYWNHREGAIESEKLEGLDAVIHLGSENVFSPYWTQEKKMRIYASRVQGTELLVDALAGLNDPPEVLLSASAMGYYGSRGDEILTEESPPAEGGFLPSTVKDWEKATLDAQAAGIRTVPLRFGIVLSPAGGALQLMRLPFLLGLGGTVGDKNQWMSWVAIDDVLYAMQHAIHNKSLNGPVNCNAPNPVTMEEFTGTFASILNRPNFLHLPGSILKLVAGEVADEFALASLRLKPKRLKNSGFSFEYPHLEDAMRHVFGYHQSGLVTKETAKVPL